MILFVLVQYRRRWWLGGWRLRGPRAYKWPLVDTATASSIINENQNNHPARFSLHYCHSFFKGACLASSFHRNRFPLPSDLVVRARWQRSAIDPDIPCMYVASILPLSFCFVDQRSTKSLACQNPNNCPLWAINFQIKKKKMCFTTIVFSISCQTPLIRLGSEDTLLLMDSSFMMFAH